LVPDPVDNLTNMNTYTNLWKTFFMHVLPAEIEEADTKFNYFIKKSLL
jgi:hypothetical protein